MRVLEGLGVSPGRAIGPLVRMPEPITEPLPKPPLPGQARPAAAQRIEAAALAVRDELEARAAAVSGEARALLDATALMAADPTLLSAAQAKVVEHGASPPRAVWEAAGEVADRLVSRGGLMAERARDVRDVRDRIVALLTDVAQPGVPAVDEPFVLAAVDLAPADTATLDPARCLALVTEQGGPTSHTAIIAKALGIPAVVTPEVRSIPDGRVVVVDGSAGTIRVDPDDEAVARLQAAPLALTFDGVASTADGHPVELLATLSDPRDLAAAVAANARGVGLFRTELAFLGHTHPPALREQIELYRQVFQAFPGGTVVVRTLDAGADKNMPFLQTGDAPNPALGVRGYRTAARAPEVLDTQLEAIAQAAAAEGADAWVMAPMISTVDEAASFVTRCGTHGLAMAGVMVETPAAALTADHIFESATFASVGTNDLSQYTMAADRLLGELAALTDPWQPAVLRLVQATAAAAARHSRPLGVCGEAASDPALAAVLVGFGVTSLSMAPRSLAAVAAVLARTSRAQCRRLAEVAVGSSTAAQARRAVRAALPALEELGL